MGLALAFGTSPAKAQNPNLIDTTRGRPTELSGSDALNKVMDDVLLGIGSAAAGITNYEGCGSNCGERQLSGAPNWWPEPTCGPNDSNGLPETNPGCQEIAPMSIPLQGFICDDDPNIEGGLSTNNQAEGFAFGADGIVIVANNNSLGAFGDTSGACSAFHASSTTPNTGSTFVNHGVGRIRSSGLLSTNYEIVDWKDALRLLYTG